MTELPDRRIPLTSAANTRDLGGLPVAGGKFAPRQAFRSAALSQLNAQDGQTFVDLDIKTVYDLRTAGEREGAPDRLPASIPSIALDVLADSPVAAAAQLNQLLANPSRLAALLQTSQGEQLLERSYRDIVLLPSANTAYREFYLSLADPEREGAALFHCTTGKDRTGWAAASLLALLGASDAVINADYLQTNTDLLPALKPLFDRAAAAGIDPEVLVPVLGVRQSYLDTAFAEVETHFGDIESYFARGLGLEDDTLDALRARFVV